MFEHSHLPNIGLTHERIPTNIYQALNQEIVDIHNNDKDIVKMIFFWLLYNFMLVIL